MKNLTLVNHLSKEVFNFSHKFDSVLSKPQQRNLRELLRGMTITGSGYLSEIAEVSAPEVTGRKNTERLSTTLSRIDTEQVHQIHINAQIPKYRNEPVLIFSDGGDSQKTYAQKMGMLCSAVDGSNGHTVGKGYPLHSFMSYGVNSHTLSPLTQRLYSHKEEEFKSVWFEEKKSFDQLRDFVDSSAHDRIIVEDRGCDDEKRFLYYRKELKASFVTRVCSGKNSRNVVIRDEDDNETTLSLQELGKKIRKNAGAKREWKNKKLKKMLTSKTAFRRVFLPDHPDMPLSAIFTYTEGFEEPLVILTDLETTSYADAWKHFFYYKKRWEIENFFRATKQSFSAEKFLVRDFNKIKAWACVVMLVFSLLLSLKHKESEFFSIIHQMVMEFSRTKRDGYKKHKKNTLHHLDILAFLRDALQGIGKEYSAHSCSIKISKYRSFIDTSQTRLFDVRFLW